MEEIFARRSIRKYKSELVNDDDIKYLLKAAMCAPSAGNQQPWQFVVIKDQHIRDSFADISPYAGMSRTAYAVIIVCGDLSKEVFPGFWTQDCSAATQNILLAATSKNLGAVWLGIYPDEDRVTKLKQLLNMPDNVMPLSAVAIGVPAENRPMNDRYLDDRVHINKW